MLKKTFQEHLAFCLKKVKAVLLRAKAAISKNLFPHNTNNKKGN